MCEEEEKDFYNSNERERDHYLCYAGKKLLLIWLALKETHYFFSTIPFWRIGLQAWNRTKFETFTSLFPLPLPLFIGEVSLNLRNLVLSATTVLSKWVGGHVLSVPSHDSWFLHVTSVRWASAARWAKIFRSSTSLLSFIMCFYNKYNTKVL